jgi:hypothetical protein
MDMKFEIKSRDNETALEDMRRLAEAEAAKAEANPVSDTGGPSK